MLLKIKHKFPQKFFLQKSKSIFYIHLKFKICQNYKFNRKKKLFINCLSYFAVPTYLIYEILIVGHRDLKLIAIKYIIIFHRS